jgi:hypothetical protein
MSTKRYRGIGSVIADIPILASQINRGMPSAALAAATTKNHSATEATRKYTEEMVSKEAF